MFKTSLKLKHRKKTELFVLLCPLIYETWKKKTRTVPAGFETDGHSYPKVLDAILGNPVASETIEAAVCHDHACREGKMSRRQADKEYSQAMSDLGWNFKSGGWSRAFRRKRNWIGVRIGAGLKWIQDKFKKRKKP